MKVKELIERLKDFDPEMPVFAVTQDSYGIDIGYAELSRIENEIWEIYEDEDFDEPFNEKTHSKVVGLYAE